MFLIALLIHFLLCINFTSSLALPDPALSDHQIDTARNLLLSRAVSNYNAVYSEGDPGNGIGGFDLRGPDRAFAFDFEGSGKTDHTVFYHPGHSVIYIIKKNPGGSLNPILASGAMFGGYDLKCPYHKLFAFDYESSGKLDRIVACQAGTGTVFILRNDGGTFTSVFQSFGGIRGFDLMKAETLLWHSTMIIVACSIICVYTTVTGIARCDLKDVRDKGLPFYYDKSGKQDHLVLYRPGAGAIAIIQHAPTSGPYFYDVYLSGAGIGDYDLKSTNDRMFALDDGDGAGKASSIVAYRPGHEVFYIINHNGANFDGRLAEEPGSGIPGIGGYNLKSTADVAFAFDYNSTGKLDHVVAYRPERGAIYILEKN